MTSFAAAAVLGVAAGNGATTILWRAFVVMVVGLLVGSAVGAIAQRTIDEHIRSYKQEHPVPGEGVATAGGDDTAVV